MILQICFFMRSTVVKRTGVGTIRILANNIALLCFTASAVKLQIVSIDSATLLLVTRILPTLYALQEVDRPRFHSSFSFREKRQLAQACATNVYEVGFVVGTSDRGCRQSK